LDRRIFLQLRKTEVALVGKNKNQPLILFRHNHWLMLQIGFVINARMKAKRGISNVHFMSDQRARTTLKEWYPISEIKPFEAVCPFFREELAAKVLTSPEEYRRLIEQGWVQLAGGFTSDTLFTITQKNGNVDLLIERIRGMMEKGEMGPFLHFDRTYDTFSQ
jgi:hypothetical protein